MSSGEDKPEVEDIDCLQAVNWLYAYIDGEIDDPDVIAKFEKHLGHCRSCYSRIELETAITKRIQVSAKGKVPDKLQKRLRKLMDEF